MSNLYGRWTDDMLLQLLHRMLCENCAVKNLHMSYSRCMRTQSLLICKIWFLILNSRGYLICWRFWLFILFLADTKAILMRCYLGLQQCPVVDLAPSGSHLCGGFLQPVPPFVGNEEGDCSGQKCSGSAEKLVSHVESHHSGFKRGGSIEDAELSSPKKRKLSVSGEFFYIKPFDWQCR